VDLARARRLARGRAFDLRYRVQGGGYTELFGRSRVERAERGRGELVLGDWVRFYPGVTCFLDSPRARIEIGNGSYLNRRAEICCRERVTVGEDCAISWDVTITDTDYHQLDESDQIAPVTIGDHVWIGARAMILKGVTIGSGAVIAAGAIVTADVPAAVLAAGTPANVIKQDVVWHAD
jgi:acetyltransferase-like isoleucine patch superfamily enzyme